MDALAFLKTIVPDDGYKWVCELLANGKFRQIPCETHEEMVEYLTKMAAKGDNLYYACSSYKEVFTKTVKTKTGEDFSYPSGRTQNNCKFVKAIWQDFDVGKYDEDGNLVAFSYETRSDALESIKKFMSMTGFPRPLLVDSGKGFHAYWPFTDAIPPKEWQQIATMVRTAFTACGVLFDPHRDQDCASILRPVGTIRHKIGKEIKVLREQVPKSHLYYKELLERFIAGQGLEVPVERESRFAEDDIGESDHPPSHPERIIQHCAQVAEFMETGGSTEPLWWMNIGLLKHCAEGETYAHKGASQHSEYDFNATQQKLDTWAYGPTTCEKFKKVNCATCEGCAYSGKIKSPIQLGYDTETKAPEVKVVQEDGTVTTEKPEHWPNGFGYAGNSLQLMVPDENGVVHGVRFASPLFYPIAREQLDDGTYALRMRMNVRGDKWREFQIPTKHIAENRSLKMSLASYEIVTYDDKAMRAYMNNYLEILRKETDEKLNFKQFGWNGSKDAFLIGTKLITEVGTSTVQVGNSVIRDPDLMGIGETKGSKEAWIEGVDTLYNREHGEPYQYTILTQFASPLAHLMDNEEWRGIPLALTSSDSGYGKTTVTKVGLAALGKASAMTIAQTTAKAIIGRASAMNHLPMLVDEVTDSLKDPIDLSDTCYALSNGRPRIGMTSDGRERIPLPPFCLMATFTANKNLHSKLTESKVNPEATQLRVFEIAMDGLPKLSTMKEGSKLHADHQELAISLINSCYGVCANEYIGWVAKNEALVREKLNRNATILMRTLGAGNANKERFYAYHMACVMTAGWICKKLGYIRWDMNALKDWAYNYILTLRRSVKSYACSIEESLSNMLADLHGTILVTVNYDSLDARAGRTEVPLLTLRGPVVARLVLGSEKERGKFYVSHKAIDAWCIKNNLQPAAFKRELHAAGLTRIHPTSETKINLGKGVPTHPVGQSYCLEIDFAAAQGYMDEFIKMNNVVELRPKSESNSVSNSETDATGTDATT